MGGIVGSAACLCAQSNWAAEGGSAGHPLWSVPALVPGYPPGCGLSLIAVCAAAFIFSSISSSTSPITPSCEAVGVRIGSAADAEPIPRSLRRPAEHEPRERCVYCGGFAPPLGGGFILPLAPPVAFVEGAPVALLPVDASVA